MRGERSEKRECPRRDSTPCRWREPPGSTMGAAGRTPRSARSGRAPPIRARCRTPSSPPRQVRNGAGRAVNGPPDASLPIQVLTCDSPLRREVGDDIPTYAGLGSARGHEDRGSREAWRLPRRLEPHPVTHDVCNGNSIQDDPEDGFSSSSLHSSRGQALRKQVSIPWIPGACRGPDPGERGK